jgi:hypothetical protein
MYGHIDKLKSQLLINNQEYDQHNDDFLIECLKEATTEIKSFFYYNCIDYEDSGCDPYIDQIANLLALGYVFLSTESLLDNLQIPKHQYFFDKGNSLLEQFKNKWKEDQACQYHNTGGHTDSVVGENHPNHCCSKHNGISSRRYCSGCRGHVI